MEVTLINLRLREWSPNIWVPLGLAYVASVLEKESHIVKIIDMNAERVVHADLISNLNKDASVVGITGMITEYQKILKISTIVKDTLPDVKIILGGPLATTLPRKLLEQSEADFVVIGEGEKTTPALIHATEHGSDSSQIRGIVYKNNGQFIISEIGEFAMRTTELLRDEKENGTAGNKGFVYIKEGHE